jgi:L-2,4-diaminobutyric acid acetyltransferase
LRIEPLPNRTEQSLNDPLDGLKASGSHISAMRRWLD